MWVSGRVVSFCNLDINEVAEFGSGTLASFNPFKGLNSHSGMVKMEGGLTCEFTFMLGLYGLIFITRV